MRKQKQAVVEAIKIDGREATPVSGVLKILKEKVGREYSRDTVYSLYRRGLIEGVPTPSANYYFIDSLEGVEAHLKPGIQGKPPQPLEKRVDKKGYPEEKRKRAMELLGGGMSRRAVAQQLGVSSQTINNWSKAATK